MSTLQREAVVPAPAPSAPGAAHKVARFSLTRIPPISVEGYRREARRRLPDMVWSYVDGAADGQVTLADNRNAFLRWRLRQRSLTGVSAPDLATRMAGEDVALPIALAPTGLSGITRWDGDVAAARAAESAGTRFVLSTGSSWTLEEVAGATQRSHWFQLYPFGNRQKVGELMKRAEDAGFTSLFVTVDVPVRGNREGERETGMGVPLTFTPWNLFDTLRRPRWVWDLFRHRRAVPIQYTQAGAVGVRAAVRAVNEQDRYMQGDLRWEDLAWMRERWSGPLYVKGVLDADDAARAVDEFGAQGVVVSNHGARQLDHALGTLDALPAIVDRIGDRAEVYLDGGIRRGTDVLIALALGAKGVFIGRPYLYGLAVAGERGARDILNILREDMVRALILMGCSDVKDLDRSWVIPAPTPSR
jgi:L-lactate dehydrogenase (cytochrome)/(S)-mandelate dehydrogenase